MTFIEWITEMPPISSEWKSMVSSTIKLSRNVKDIPFHKNVSIQEQKTINKLVDESISLWNKENDNTFLVCPLTTLTNGDIQALREYGIDIPNIEHRESQKLYLSKDRLLVILTNGIEHITLWGISFEADITQIWDKLSRLDTWLAQKISFAFDNEFGYLTASPLIAGTGMEIRATVFLPGITNVNQMDNLSGKLARSGYKISKLRNHFYFIENSFSMGLKEETFCNRLEEVQKNIEYIEEKAWNSFYDINQQQIKDKIWRSLGIFSYARSLNYEETLECIAWLYIGMRFNILPIKDRLLFYKLLRLAGPFYVEKKIHKEEMSENDINTWRAVLIRDVIKEMSL